VAPAEPKRDFREPEPGPDPEPGGIEPALDPLTRLPSRPYFDQRAAQGVADATRHGRRLAVLSLELDRAAKLGRGLGPAMVDEIVKQAARRLESLVREGDTVARIGPHEFAIQLCDPSLDLDAARVGERVLRCFLEPLALLGAYEFFATTSIGIAVFPQDATSPSALLESARTAMQHASVRGGNRYCFYTRRMNEVALERLTLEQNLRQALRKCELFLEYQPQVDVIRSRVVGAEALLRWNHPELGRLSPDAFIPLAEESLEILPIGEWVLRTACRQARAWELTGRSPRIAVNLSPRQLQRPDFAGYVGKILKEEEFDAERLELEITESCLMEDTDGSAKALSALKSLGVWITLDDFGTGFSCLSHLRQLPFDALKIDRSFVGGLLHDPADASITAAIVNLGRALGLTTTAEGVETREQLSLLASWGCTRVQGHLLGAAMDGDSFGSKLRDARSCWDHGNADDPQ